jgi:hypothetical protein
MAAILRKKSQRDGIGKQSVLKVRGRAINLEEVHHYFRRKGIALDKVFARHAGASTAPGISCTTPPFSPRFTLEVPRSPSTPHSLAVPEKLIFNIDRYLSVSINSSVWVLTDNGECINSISGGNLDDLRSFASYCRISADLFKKKSYIYGRRTLSKACGLIPSIIKEENPRTIEYLLRTFLSLIRQKLPEVVTQLAAYVSRMARVLLDAEHPWGQIWRMLGSIAPDHAKSMIIQCLQCMNKVFSQILGKLHQLSVSSGFYSIYNSDSRDSVLAEQRLRQIKLQHRGNIGIPNRGSLDIIDEIWVMLYNQARYAEAESTAYELLNNAREAGYFGYQVLGLENAARSQFKQGKFDLAETNVIEAVKLIDRYGESTDPWALSVMVRLQSCFQDWGFEQKAAELGLQIERMMSLAKLDIDDE